MDKFYPTGKKDIDISVLSNLDDNSLREACLINRYVSELCRDNKLWLLKVRKLIGTDLFEYTMQDFRNNTIKSFRDFYIVLVTLISKLNSLYNNVVFYDNSLKLNSLGFSDLLVLDQSISDQQYDFFIYAQRYKSMIRNYVWYYLYSLISDMYYPYSKNRHLNFESLLRDKLRTSTQEIQDQFFANN